jgi:hypothetical protein
MAEKKITREEYAEAVDRVKKYIEQETTEKGKPCWICAHKIMTSIIIVFTDELNAKVLSNSGDYIMYKAVLYD